MGEGTEVHREVPCPMEVEEELSMGGIRRANETEGPGLKAGLGSRSSPQNLQAAPPPLPTDRLSLFSQKSI